MITAKAIIIIICHKYSIIVVKKKILALILFDITANVQIAAGK